MSTNPITGQVEVQTDGEPVSIRLHRLSGREEIGRCFELRIVGSVSEDVHEDGLDGADLVGRRCSVVLERVEADGQTATLRTFHGILAAVEDGLEARGRRYQLELTVVPRVWELGNVVTQEIFVGQTVPEVIRAKLEAAGMTEGDDFAFRLADPEAYRTPSATLGSLHADGAKAPTAPEPRLIVQYKESDLAFLSRLCEHEGISFFFEHVGGRDRIVFADSPAGFAASSSALPYGQEGQAGAIRSIARRFRSVPSTFYVLDHNYRAPDLTLDDAEGAIVFETLGARADLDAAGPGSVVELAPNVKTQGEADRIARVRAEEREHDRDRYAGSADLPVLAAGLRATVTGHARLCGGSADLLFVRVDHELGTPEATHRGHGESTEYAARFEAVDAARTLSSGRVVTYRPPRTTPRPRVFGLLTGVVRAVDQPDPIPDEALAARQHIDAEGRYLVRLHFDQGEAVMPRVRMAQPHAGGAYGMHFPLRPGVEVVVAFLDGDPDRPVILGAVPNPLHRAPVRSEPSSVTEALLHMNEMNRIETRSGCIIQIGDGDPGLLSVP